LHLPDASRGLDVGCGVGWYALWLAAAIGPQGHVVGIDPSGERVEAAKRLAQTPGQHATLEFRQGDGNAIEAPTHSFDWVWCGDVLHHIDTPQVALQEFIRVVRPGGTIIIKESQVLQALFLPGHLELEKQLQRAEIQVNRQEAGAVSFQERRQRTVTTMYEAGLSPVQIRTYMVERHAPLDEATRGYIQHSIFARNWGPRLRPFLDAQDWQQRSALCEVDSPQYILQSPAYYCLYPITLFTASVPR
ncbi:MAG: methyltransferase domain-containing protein, partial [Candidatus Tectomicrobia bacterium]|nr:methyltransferase domain-containing protein [Candidatus Tectomicrobia bacterium]